MFSSPFQQLSKASVKKLLILAVTTFLLAATCMIKFDTPLKTSEAPLGIVSFEIAKTVEKSDAIIKSWKAVDGAMQSAEWSLWFDYIFIITYVLLLTLLIHKVTVNIWADVQSQVHRLGMVLIRMVIFAGVLDMVENFALLQTFYYDSQTHWVTLAFAAASVKFIMLALGIVYVLVAYISFLLKKNTRVKK